MSIRDEFAKPDEVRASSTERTPIFSLKSGESMVVRIFPAMKELRQKLGVEGFVAYHTTHYGFKTRDRLDPTRLKDASLMCLERKDSTGKTVVSCPLDRQYDAKEQEYADNVNTAIAKNMASGMNNADAKVKAEEEFAETKAWLDMHRADKRAYMVVMKDTNEIGILKVPQSLIYGDPEKKKFSKTYGLAYHRRKTMEQYGVDLLDVDHGVWVRFSRKGTGFSSSYSVEPVLEKTIINGKAVTMPKEAPLTDEQLTQAYACPSLTALPWMRRVNLEQMRMLAECSGDPEEVEMILNLAQKVEGSPRTEASPAPTQVSRAAQVVQPVNTRPPETAVDEEDLDAQIAALRAKKAAKSAADKAQKTEGQILSEESDEVDDAEFMRRFGK
jgi:hypothetical protein